MKEIANLTGHDITIVNYEGTIIKTIKPCEYEEPIRASIQFENLGHCEGAPLDIITHSCDISDEKMKELQRNYSIIFITGRKFFLNGEMVGVRSLSKYC